MSDIQTLEELDFKVIVDIAIFLAVFLSISKTE